MLHQLYDLVLTGALLWAILWLCWLYSGKHKLTVILPKDATVDDIFVSRKRRVKSKNTLTANQQAMVNELLLKHQDVLNCTEIAFLNALDISLQPMGQAQRDKLTELFTRTYGEPQ